MPRNSCPHDRGQTGVLDQWWNWLRQDALLAALLGLVPAHERVVIVEDSRELAPNHPHVVRIEDRPANTELAGAITLTDLVRQSLRMRPDRLVVGEVRGAEICDLLTAMNTGQEASCWA